VVLARAIGWGASHFWEWRGRGRPSLCVVSGAPPPSTRKNGEKALILRALCARKMSALNEKMQKWDAPDWVWVGIQNSKFKMLILNVATQRV
jgi:hypothetical protein